jgi:hypothetical protein
VQPTQAPEQKLPELPEEPTPGADVCELSIRLPDSSQLRRRFPKNAPLQQVFDFLAHKGYSMSKYSLISTYPPTSYSETTKSLDQYGKHTALPLLTLQVWIEEQLLC